MSSEAGDGSRGTASSKLGHRRVHDDGEVTYKKFGTAHLMGSFQLGIRQAVGSLAHVPDRDLLMSDFMVEELISFTRDGSFQKTPAHNFTEFRFRTYAPFAFRTFRKMFEIDQELFLVSLGSLPMKELSNPGASGSIFYRTADDNFISKTVQHKEAEFLQKLLPGYYMNLQQNKRTLLPKFFGLYCYSVNAKNVRLTIMNNLLPSGLKMHQKFDLKGSTYKRKASAKERAKGTPTYKDLDFLEMYSEGIFLQSELYDNLINAISRDCRFLESFKIMDYSLLIGIHNLDQGSRDETDDIPEERPVGGSHVRNGSFQTRIIAHSTALESITVQIEENPEPETKTYESPSGIRNIWGGIPARNQRGENLLIFIGIIDILQEYGMFKKVEHYWKSLIHDGDTVSVHKPGFYAKRFQDFMKEHVFKKISPGNGGGGNSSGNKKAHLKRMASKDESLKGKSENTTVITIGSDGSEVFFPPVLQGRGPKKSGNSPNSKKNSDEGFITLSSDEKVQIYVPSPSTTPYNTISKDSSNSSQIKISVGSEDSPPVSLSDITLTEDT